MAYTSNINIEAFYKVTYGLFIVSSKINNKYNGFISNAVFQVTAEPAQFAVCCNKDNYTAEYISQSSVFSISVLQKDTPAALIGLFGYRSGKDVNKFEKINYITGISGVPIVIDNTIAWFECRLNQTVDAGSHLIFIGELINSNITAINDDPLTYTYYREVKKGVAPKNAPTYIDKSKLVHF